MSGSPIQYVTLVSGGGTPIRLADQSGTPYPTTGYGAIVFSLNPTLNGATFTGPVIFDEGRLGFMLGSAAQPSIYFGDIANKDGFFSAGPGHVNTAIGGMPIVDVSASGLNVAGNVTFSGTLAGVIPTPLTTRGDIYYRGESGNTRLPLGSPGYVLGSNGIDAAWTAVGSGTITSIASGVGIVTTPDPITATGSIALATNGVVAGSYGGTTNSVQLTVDVYGRITTIINAAIPLASYLPLTGGTLVGALTGTTATFTDQITSTTSLTGASTPALNITQTWNNAATAFVALNVNAIDTASASGALLARFQVGGSDRLSITKSGGIVSVSGIAAGAGNFLYWVGRSVMSSPADGQIRLTNQAQTDFSRLQFGGITSAFPAIKRNLTALNFRTADDTADVPITAAAATLTGALTGTTATFNNLIYGPLAATGTNAGFGGDGLNVGIRTYSGGGIYFQGPAGIPTWGYFGPTGQLQLLNNLVVDGTTTLQSALTGTTATFSGALTALNATAVGAGANTQAFIKASSTANLGIYYGTGAPAFTAAKGSLYSNTTAASTTTRLYVNTDGGTTWASFTASA